MHRERFFLVLFRSLELGDGTVKVFLNPYGTVDDTDEKMKNFLMYLADGTISDEFTRQLDDEVESVKNNEEWRVEYMTLQMKYDEIEEKAKAKGRREGEKRGGKKERVKAVVYMLKKGISESDLKADYPDEFEEGKAEYLRMKKQEE